MHRLPLASRHYPRRFISPRLQPAFPYFLHNLTASAANRQRLPSSLVIENPRQSRSSFDLYMARLGFPMNANDFPGTCPHQSGGNQGLSTFKSFLTPFLRTLRYFPPSLRWLAWRPPL